MVINNSCIDIFFQSSSNVENVCPQVIRQINKELTELMADQPEGISIYPNDEDITDIQAIIEGPGV